MVHLLLVIKILLASSPIRMILKHANGLSLPHHALHIACQDAHTDLLPAAGAGATRIFG
jgi:hypothetical protein